MMGRIVFLTHADVVIDPEVPVPDWGLNETGRARHQGFALSPTLRSVTAIYSSTERKARDGAEISASDLGLEVISQPDLGENDRSATGFLPPDEFWPVVDQFFSAPDVSVLGWETARAAQSRITSATAKIAANAQDGDILIVSHGGVATLLRCHLLGLPISQDQGQPHPKGGCWFAFDRDMTTAPTGWSAI